jgi:hypothetical protein
MANKYSFDGNVGVLYEDVTALANAGTVTFDFSPYEVAHFSVISESATGEIRGPSSSTFRVAVNRTTKVATITNVLGVAFTGTYKLIGLFY